MRRVIIVGGGASVREGLSLKLWEKIKNEEVWSVNFAFMTMPFLPKREIWIDKGFFRGGKGLSGYAEEIQKLYNQGVECHTKKHPIYSYIPEIFQHEVTRDIEIHKKNPKVLYVGYMGLGGFLALSLAVVKEKCDEVYLLGYDFGTVSPNDNLTHYYQDKLKVDSSGIGCPKLYRQEKSNRISEHVQNFSYFNAFQTKIYNVSPQSNIPYFPKLDYPSFFNQLEKKC